MLNVPDKLENIRRSTSNLHNDSNYKINKTVREDANETLANLLRSAIAIATAPAETISKSCISCEHFNEGMEICNKVNKKPPARIIAFGCEYYCDKDFIPF